MMTTKSEHDDDELMILFRKYKKRAKKPGAQITEKLAHKLKKIEKKCKKLAAARQDWNDRMAQLEVRRAKVRKHMDVGNKQVLALVAKKIREDYDALQEEWKPLGADIDSMRKDLKWKKLSMEDSEMSEDEEPPASKDLKGTHSLEDSAMSEDEELSSLPTAKRAVFETHLLALPAALFACLTTVFLASLACAAEYDLLDAGRLSSLHGISSAVWSPVAAGLSAPKLAKACRRLLVC
eukprot:gnl/TRDRNA2_/TRDRNA2_138956_c0_seq2.p1 gnl/TRDRNA2_/TRDRNA2_138956_c0~~gnl/TRDRNA2_/TRDRNA2_138956_c0_seq2.p1  ORF type:complete len:237 (+),score=58.74 gnl/TRDRNA2_/TRDRNA2_138956_c0_seq2:3-713(+)